MHSVIITNKYELEITELTINELRRLETIILDEIKEKSHPLNIDFNRLTIINGAIARQSRWLSHFKFQVALGRGDKCPEYLSKMAT